MNRAQTDIPSPAARSHVRHHEAGHNLLLDREDFWRIRDPCAVETIEKNVLDAVPIDRPIAVQRSGNRNAAQEVARRRPGSEVGSGADAAAAAGGQQWQEEAAVRGGLEVRLALVIGVLQAELDRLQRPSVQK